jgi:hypothetical protein
MDAIDPISYRNSGYRASGSTLCLWKVTTILATVRQLACSFYRAHKCCSTFYFPFPRTPLPLLWLLDQDLLGEARELAEVTPDVEPPLLPTLVGEGKLGRNVHGRSFMAKLEHTAASSEWPLGAPLLFDIMVSSTQNK